MIQTKTQFFSVLSVFSKISQLAKLGEKTITIEIDDSIAIHAMEELQMVAKACEEMGLTLIFEQE